MKIFFIVLFAFFASAGFAQDTTQQQLPPSVQTDTTSGWQLVFTNPHYGNGHYIGDLQFPSKDTGYATGWNGSNLVLLRSTNAGLNWDSLPTPIAGYPVYFTSALIGYAAGRFADKLVWKTIDGGMSWKSYAENSNATGIFAFSNNDTGVLLGKDYTARTTDGGSAWSDILTTFGGIDKNGASFGDSKVGYVVGSVLYDPPTYPYRAGFCEKTIDGGATWKFVNTGIPVDLLCCQAFGKNTLYVAGSAGSSGGQGGYMGRTFDGGISWDTLHITDKRYYLPVMSFADIGHGMVAGNDDATGINSHGVVFSTIDTGKTWQKQYLPNAPELYGVAMINDSIALICGAGNIYRTTVDGNFSSVSQQNINFQVQIFPNPSSGIITIQYLLPSASSVSYLIYNIQGIQVGVMNFGIQNSGTQQTTFDGSSLPNGAYYFSLTVGSNQQTIPFTIQK
jgi:photosystem II stability/assembly factor-like uncharacterized protein